MKKKGKGRVAGTIGWILAVSLCLGTVAFGTYQCVNGVIGASTGNAITARIDQKSLDEAALETKKLLAETALTYEAPTKGATYTSYTMEYSGAATFLTDASVSMGEMFEQEISTVVATVNGVFRVSNDYTYEKVNAIMMIDAQMMNVVTERYLVKETGEWYQRTNTFYGESASDKLLLDSAKWQKDSIEILSEGGGFDLGIYSTGTQVIQSYLPLLTEELEFSVIDAEYTCTPQYSKEFLEMMDLTELTSRYGFKAGRRPTFFAQSYTVMDSKESVDGASSSIYMKTNGSSTLTYSNLNNTKVELPQSLKDFIKSQAEVKA